MMQTIQNLILSSTYRDEFSIVNREIEEFMKNVKPGSGTIQLKRMKGTVERALRLAKSFTSLIIEKF